ncbi:hypothetical protein DPQ33_01065 [Oceanidesulfovibrio indonesiensis]|uniref:DUF4129 domain-containing protein n=1 Tax=Oceanidesulfovibrio indonesiensis TaxID=54767 RepID=A0A7M3MJ67_9BACT|nr:DUF4129 domain-containing protein [Oceanidesulfovibrio indonesiensis]TVM19853.1 hypothetical protein DPQ33_01065 [Oceanidesulfovibrio indonesiensis]
MAAGSDITPESARQLAEEVLAREHYELERHVVENALLEWLGDMLDPVARFLSKAIGGLIRFFGNIHDANPVLYWLILVSLSLLLVALLAHIVLTFRQALRERQRTGALTWAEAAEEGPDLLEKRARGAAQSEDYFLALSLLFQAGVLRLEMREDRPFQPAYTNREYLRRYETDPAHAPLARLAALLEHWYAGEPIGRKEYEDGADVYTSLRTLAASGGRG